MNKPEKAGTDDLKRMLRRLERIEAEKAERAQARSKGPGQTRDLSSLPPAKRRPEMSLSERLSESGQSVRRGLAPPLHLAPELPGVITPPPLPDIKAANQDWAEPVRPERQVVSVLTDPREFTKEGRRERQRSSAIIAAAVAALSLTVGTIWLTGGFDSTQNGGVPFSAKSGGKATGQISSSEPAAAAASSKAATAPASSQSDAPAARVVGDNRIAPEATPPGSKDEPSPDYVLEPPPIEPAGSRAAETAADRQTSAPEAEAADAAPPAPVAASQAPQGALPGTPSTPAAPGSIQLVSPASVAAEPGVPLAFPVSVEAGSGDLKGYYLVVSGLKRGSTFSRGVELLFDTWQIPATSLSGLQLTTQSGFARRMNLKVELRGPSGEVVKRTTLTVELPGPARRAVGLDGPEASGDRPPSAAAQDLIDKAEVFLDNGSLQGARLLLERAAAQGAGAAAMMLATSYDPQYAKHFSAEHPDPDAALAKQWYERASELGVIAAGQRLNSAAAP